MNNPDLFNLGKTNKVSDEKQNSESVLNVDDNIDDESEIDNSVPQVTELDMLKQRARLMNITFSNNIGVEALAKKIQEKLDGEVTKNTESGEGETPETEKNEQVKSGGAAAAFTSPDVDAGSVRAAAEARGERMTAKSKKMSLRQRLLRDAMKLVRVRITNLDPKKKDLPGEIITVANEYIGTVRKYVPFGEVTDNGYHVPHCVYRVLQSRKFLSIKVTKKNGREHVETQWAKEFALEVLPPLTVDELARLASAQMASGSIE